MLMTKLTPINFYFINFFSFWARQWLFQIYFTANIFNRLKWMGIVCEFCGKILLPQTKESEYWLYGTPTWNTFQRIYEPHSLLRSPFLSGYKIIFLNWVTHWTCHFRWSAANFTYQLVILIEFLLIYDCFNHPFHEGITALNLNFDQFVSR